MHLPKTITKSLIIAASVLALSACASKKNKNYSNVDTANYSQLAGLTGGDNIKNSALNQLRVHAVEETALQLGAQGGLAWRSEQINKDLEKEAMRLRNVFKFNALILDNGILPPVLTEGNNTLNQESPTTIRITDKSYKIVSNARFITAPPTWRDYLISHFKKPELPNAVLFPKDAKEQAAWKKNLAIGWEKGIEQADTIYNENLARLKRDYHGMILYRKLLAMHMVTPPYVAKTDLGVTGDSENLNIGDKVLRISALPAMQTNSHEWKAYVVER